MAFIYENPLEKGYYKVKLSRKNHNELFPKRPMRWCHRYEYYMYAGGEHMIMHRFVNTYALIVLIFMIPVYIPIVGLGGISKLYEEYKRSFLQKKYGSFSSDMVRDKKTLNCIKELNKVT